MSKFLNIQTNDFDSWFDSVNLNMEFWESPVCAARIGYEAGQQSRQEEIDELNLKIKRLIESEEAIARSCEHWKESFFRLVISIRKAVKALELTPYWDRSGNCETAISILKKTEE